MKIGPIFFVAIILSLYSSLGLSYQTIVPNEDQISDYETLGILANILSHHEETQEAALQLYEEILNETPQPILKRPKIVSEPKLELENSESIVPKTSWIDRYEAEWALAKIYTHLEKNEAALGLYTRLLQEKPDNLELVIELGRLYINLKRYSEGLDLFYTALETHPCNLKLLIATAQSQVILGHAQEANRLFLIGLSVSEADESTLLEYANGMMMWGDFYKAEGIYRSALAKEPCLMDLNLKLAWSLEGQQRYEEAEGIYRDLLLECPNDLKALESLTRLKIQEKDFDQAKEWVQTLLEIDPANPKYLQLLAEILFQEQLYCDAIAVFDEFKNDRKYGIRAYVGMGRAYQKMGLELEAKEAFENAYAIDPNDIEARYYNEEESLADEIFIKSTQDLYDLANIYLQNGNAEMALTVYTSIAERDPEYFPGQIGLAETLNVFFCYTGALEIYETLLESFPENGKIMLAIARTYAWSKDYQTAIESYDTLIQLNPVNPVSYREKARTALWDKRFDLSMETYNILLERPIENFSDSLIYKSVFLEKRAKVLNWNKRYLCALPAYEELVEFNPGNEEALFDFAQVYCSIGLCSESKRIYEHLLDLDPNHSLVKKALYRNEIRNNIGLQANFTYWRELGSGSFSASQIARYRLDEVIEVPLSCSAHVRFIQQEYVENPFFNFKFYPAQGQTIEADFLFNEHVSGFTGVTYKNYFGKFNSTFTTHNRLLFTVNDYLQVLLSYNKEDEIYNYFSLEQATQSHIGLLTLSSNLTRYWGISGTCQYYNYNDNNSQIHYNLFTEYQLTDGPDVLKVILQGDYRNAAHLTISNGIGAQLTCMTHPYWTPKRYFSGSLTLEWRHDYREFEFCEAPQRYFDVKVTGLTDNANNPSIAGIVEWKHDFECHFGFEIKGYIQRGPLWRAEGAWGTLSYRF